MTPTTGQAWTTAVAVRAVPDATGGGHGGQATIALRALFVGVVVARSGQTIGPQRIAGSSAPLVVPTAGNGHG